MALFNGIRYWHAHEAWETLWRAADDEDRDFYQGLIQVAAGLLHLQRRNVRGARNKLAEGLEKLAKYEPAHRGIVVSELVAKGQLILNGPRPGPGPVPHPAGHSLRRDGPRAGLRPMSEGDRVEHDSMGEVQVPAGARWGAQTQRAVENFPICGQRSSPS